MTDIKPCPFCGEQPDIDTAGGTAVWPICNACENENTSKAVYRWNTRPREAALDAEIAGLRIKLAAFEGQLTAEEMRERCAQWHEDRARIAMRSTHRGDKEHAILAAHCRADWHENVADELRSIPTKREEG